MLVSPVSPVVGSVPGAATAQAMLSLAQKSCRSLVMPCPEDVTIDHEYERVYISSWSRPRLRRPTSTVAFGFQTGLPDFPNPFKPASASLVNGAILTLTLSNLDAPVVNQTAELSELGAFRPVGIDFLPIDSAQARLFVTDRPADGRARVVIFDVERASGALSRPQFIENESFIRAPNEIAAVSTDAFYFTNTQESRFQWQQLIETVVPIGFGSIVSCRLMTDGPVFHVDDAFKHFPNGVAYESATKRLYVAASMAKKIMVYGVVGAASKPRLVPLAEIAVPVAADNLTWDAAGNLWVAGSPDLAALMFYTVGQREDCPSEVVRIVDPSGAARVEPVFTDDGQLISAASVGAYHETGGRRQLVVGAPFQNRLLVVDW
ncbi:MAG: SMP-30/gluconolactonase/LRE family protein [Candidatus Accumulibacter sp.]|nr:SMP-30/gluconolactonase/LRE family protein [Accumulibacter sp.]